MIGFNFDNTYKQLPGEMFSKVKAVSVKQPDLILFNTELARALSINLKNYSDNELANVFCGNVTPENAAGISQAYCGHQFGHFTTLGDGRAILLGEQITSNGQRFDLQFKGSGITPYSRRGDGKATVNAMLREFIFSEALYALNIPTTRSLAVVATGEPVYRDDVNAGAILTRVAKSHIRVGTFEYAQQFAQDSTLKKLVEYAVKRHFPELNDSKNLALLLLKRVMELQAELIVNWMRVGFIHGVMNTDNMLISGETIDYGPCAFMNVYKPSTVFSSIDNFGRYAFDKQPSIALWNLSRLAESLLTEIDKNTSIAVEKATEVLAAFKPLFRNHYQKMMCEKIGIENAEQEDIDLVNSLLRLMEANNADYTNTFVQLMYPEMKLNDSFEKPEVKQWITAWKERLKKKTNSAVTQLALMQQNNPVYIPRNYIVEDVLTRAIDGNLEPLNVFLQKLANPYASTKFNVDYMKAPNLEYDEKYKTFCGT